MYSIYAKRHDEWVRLALFYAPVAGRKDRDGKAPVYDQGMIPFMTSKQP